MCLGKRQWLKSLESLRWFIRCIALFEGIVATIAITVKVVLISLEYESLSKEGTDQAAAREQMTKIVVLSVFVLQGVFAIILHEGARKKIMCMIKTWLVYCFLQLLIPMTIVFTNLFLLRNHRLPGVTIWAMFVQVGLGIFHGIEATFVISFYKKAETYAQDEFMMTLEYHKNKESIAEWSVHSLRKSDVSISIDADVGIDADGDKTIK